jgi:hypothetical protein
MCLVSREIMLYGGLRSKWSRGKGSRPAEASLVVHESDSAECLTYSTLEWGICSSSIIILL